MPRRTVWKVFWCAPRQVYGVGLVNQPVVGAEELEADRGWLGGVVEAVNVAADGLEEVVAAADVDVGADEVVGGDIEKLTCAALRCY